METNDADDDDNDDDKCLYGSMYGLKAFTRRKYKFPMTT